MTDQAAIDAALDALEFDSDPIEQAVEQVEQAIEVDEPEVVAQVVADEPLVADKPPGYISYEDWVADGKDPDLFKGKKAYEAEYDRIQEVRELKGLVKTVVDTTNDWKTQQQESMNAQIEQAKIDAMARLEIAKEENDIDAVIAAKDDLTKIERTEQPVNAPKPMNKEVTGFIAKNPIIDKASPNYDQEFWDTMSIAQGTVLNDLSGGNPNTQFTDAQIARSMSLAYNKAKAFHEDKFVSPRNKRKGGSPAPSKRTPSSPTGDYATRLKQVNIPSMNKRDVSAANDMYEMIKAKDPARAEAFAKTMLGDK